MLQQSEKGSARRTNGLYIGAAWPSRLPATCCLGFADPFAFSLLVSLSDNPVLTPLAVSYKNAEADIITTAAKNGAAFPK